MTRRTVSLLGILVSWVVIVGLLSLPRTPVAAPLLAAPPTMEELRTYAVVSEAKRLGADPKLMLQISRQENYSGIPNAWSRTDCCAGIMQIHVREWLGVFHEECGGSDLINLRENACYGIHIFQLYLKEPCKGDTTCALRSYFMGPNDRHKEIGGIYVQRVYARSHVGWDMDLEMP